METMIMIWIVSNGGIFDHRSSRRDCSTTFALSMLLALVQCHNVMQNVQIDDLENLEMFAEYGRLALEQSHKKPFQQFFFIIRDWPKWKIHCKIATNRFIEYVKESVPALFAPQNLVSKKINNESVRIGDFLQYLHAYAELFNGNKLPESKTILTVWFFVFFC